MDKRNVRLCVTVFAASVVVLGAMLPAVATTDGTFERYSGGPLTLAAALARVDGANFDVRMARGMAVSAAGDAAAAAASARPQVALGGTAAVANLPQFGMPVARQAYASLTATVPLFAPSSTGNARASRAAGEAAQLDVETARNDAAFAIAQAYRRAQLATALVQVRNTAVIDQREHLALTQVRIASGKTPRYVALRDRAALAQSEQQEEDAAAERDKALADLATVLAYDPASPLTIAEPLARAPAPDQMEEALVASALANRPNVRAAVQRADAAELAVRAARAAYDPSASLSAQSYNGGSTPNLGTSGGQVSMALSLPVVDGGTRSGAMTKARGELERAKAALDQARATAARDAIDALRDVRAARTNLATAAAAERDAEAQLAVARLRESAGKAIELEALDALAVAATAREGALRALAVYDVAVAVLHHATGTPQV
jgi:outer membrane protein TolC